MKLLPSMLGAAALVAATWAPQALAQVKWDLPPA